MILVTGGTGFLGRNIQDLIRNSSQFDDYIFLGKKDFDLIEKDNAYEMYKLYKPKKVIHLAALSGGIGDNDSRPADYLYINNTINNNVFKFACDFKVEKILYTMGGCSYPANAISPISENTLFEGMPQEQSSAYSLTKALGYIALQSYRKQYGLNFMTLVPGNLYGSYDNFNLEKSHVIPAMIRKLYEAKLNNLKSLTFWGTGAPKRDFVFCADVAKILIHYVNNKSKFDIVNVSSQSSISMKDLALSIKKIIGYDLDILWDTSRPDGQLVKIYDSSRIHNEGLYCETSLTDGLTETIKWFQYHYNIKSENLRL